MTEVGDLIGARYRLVGRVGSGSMGVVWQAQDEILRRDVAVKELRLLPGMSEAQMDEARRRTMREGRITARLQHPNAITVYDVAENHGRPCLIMEFLPSSSLSDLLDDNPSALSVTETARMGKQIAAALAAAHDAGIVHRDVKPGNVLLTKDGTAKLTDFGISHAVGDGTITASGVLAGTPAFLPPEVAKGQDPDFRSDVFSLGATLYAALEGQPPFGVNDNPIGMLHQIATQDVIPPTKSGALTATLKWMLQLDPAARPTMREAEQALAAVSEGAQAEPEPVAVPVTPEPPPPPPAPVATTVAAAPVEDAAPVESGRKRRRALMAGAAVVVLAVVGILVATLTSGNGSPTASPPANHPTTTTQTQQHAAPPATTTTGTTPTTTTTSPPPAGTTTVGTKQVTNPASAGVPSDPVRFITAYYKLVPGNLQAAWPWMTAGYQNNHAGGWSGYTKFWGAVASVQASDVVAQGSTSVVATIRYTEKAGNVIVERTEFGLVRQDGQLKIASSSVLSHSG
ncbi:MAG TPA: serine/threonine-protein kinase [Pseudonocardiaceae bacterium]|nr:serine/threonine-protein kinase [Pseudonocardiaceae bacterium]